MKSTSLYDQWRAMDDARLSSKPVSIRLPVHVLARVNAISGMFPSKTRTDILTDLIKTGLESFESSLPPLYFSEEAIEVEPNFYVHLPVGVNAEYQNKANDQYCELEKELGNNRPQNLFSLESKKV